MSKILRNKKGVALATTVLVVAVITILTTALLMIATFSLKHAYKMSNRQQAYFTARSAAVKFKKYIENGGYINLINDKIKGKIEFASGGNDFTMGEFEIRVERIGTSKKVRVTAIGEYLKEKNSAVVYIIDEFEHAPFVPKNNNMIIASSITDRNNGAPQYFTSTLFVGVEAVAKKNPHNVNVDPTNAGDRNKISQEIYKTYISQYPNREDTMTHLYTKSNQTNLDLQASYYSGYVISESSVSIKGVGATCYGVRVDGNFTLPQGSGSNFYVYGDVFASGNVIMPTNTETYIYGDVYVGGNATIDNIHVYGNIYVCGYDSVTDSEASQRIPQDKRKIVNQGNLAINKARVDYFLGHVYCNQWSSLGENNNVWLPFESSGRWHPNTTEAELANARQILLETIADDVYGKAAYITVNHEVANNADEKENPIITALKNGPYAKYMYDATNKAIMLVESGRWDSTTMTNDKNSSSIANNFINSTGASVATPSGGNMHEVFKNSCSTSSSGDYGYLIIDARNHEINIYMEPNTTLMMRQTDWSSIPFNKIAVIGDYPVRIFLGEGVKFDLENSRIVKIKDLGTKTSYWAKMAVDDPDYTEPDPLDEPNLYILSDQIKIDIKIQGSDFYGYIILPNELSTTNQPVGENDKSKVRIHAKDGKKIYGSVFADRFEFIDSGNMNNGSKFCFIPPGDKFTNNLDGWITVINPLGDAFGGGEVGNTYIGSDMYKGNLPLEANKSGVETVEIQGRGTRYFAFN